ncbi:MAG: hypothetical protein CM1200mP34_5610 [Verrucomicrobiales bacterium]|nr:MAG: hypothetical protein CM1200mP34_5610 [Verrucomicrobiales bacterium]
MLVGLGGQVLYPVAKPTRRPFEYQVQIDGQAVAVPEAGLANRLAEGGKPLPTLTSARVRGISIKSWSRAKTPPAGVLGRRDSRWGRW